MVNILKPSRILLVLQVFLLLFMGVLIITPSVLALSDDDLQSLYNNTEWYVGNGINCAPSSTTSPSQPGTAFFVGDSLTVGMKGGGLVSKMQANGWKVSQIEATVGIDVADSVTKVKSPTDQNNIKNSTAAIVELGTNPRSDTTASVDSFIPEIQSMVSAIKAANSSIQIYWMTAYWDGQPGYYDGVNQAIFNQASQQGYKVIDWHTEALNNRSKYAPFPGDPPVHPVDHYPELADFVINSLSSVNTVGGADCSCSNFLTGSDNEEKIWNFFASKGIPALANAALMGNIQTETAGTWNPRINNISSNPSDPQFSDFPNSINEAYGLAQWLGGRQTTLVERAHSQGVIAGDLALQLNYIWDELNGSYKTSTLDVITSPGEVLGSTGPNPDPKDAVYTVVRYYEGATDASQKYGVQGYDSRLANAKAIYQQYGNSGAGGGGACGGTCVNGAGATTGNAAILCEAQKYKGIYYLFDGGHNYSDFRQKCPENAISSAAASSTPSDPGPCATDCSGLVTVAVDAVYNLSYSWSVDNSGNITGSGSDLWKPLSSIDQAQAGDIVTKAGNGGHVEIVDHVQNGTVYSFGSHAPKVQTGPTQASESYWTKAYRWSGAGGTSK